MRFYGREKELSKIRSYIVNKEDDKSRIIVITGRRRIGKTRLALEAVRNHNFLYFFVTRKKEATQIIDWSNQIKEKMGNAFLGNLQSIDDLLTFLFEYAKSEQLAVIFDEFQNFSYTNPAAYSVFQMYYDKYKYDSSLKLIFSGSSYSMMENIFKGYKEPLFGRSDDIIHLSYLSLHSQQEFMNEQGLESQNDAIYLFSVFDGIPKYLEDIHRYSKSSFLGRFRELLKEKDWIWDEGESILKEEFGKEYTSYFSILSAISKGRRIIDEIKQFTGIKEVGAFIKKLEVNYNMIERRLPITEKQRQSKKGRYYLKDNFISFWFSHIEPNKYLKEIGQEDIAIERIIAAVSQFSGRKFEQMVIRKIIEENPFDIQFTRIGNYWDRKGEVEIDVIVMNEFEKKAFFFEIKLSKSKINKKIISNLVSNAEKIRDLEDYHKFYYTVYPEKNEIKFHPIEIINEF